MKRAAEKHTREEVAVQEFCKMLGFSPVSIHKLTGDGRIVRLPQPERREKETPAHELS